MPVRQGFMIEGEPDFRAAFADAAEFGFDFVELNMESTFSPGTVDPDAVRSAAEEYGLDLVVHLPYAVDVGSPHEHAREGACRDVEDAIDVAIEFGARKGVFHAQTFAEPYHWDDEYVRERIFESVQRLHEYGSDRGFRACAENLKGHVVDVTDFPDLLSATDAPACLDTGHAFVSGMDGREQADFLREYGDRIDHVHLNETRRDDDDEHLPVGIGRVDFAAIAAAMVESDWSGTCTHEVLSFDPDHSLVAGGKRRFDALLSAARE